MDLGSRNTGSAISRLKSPNPALNNKLIRTFKEWGCISVKSAYKLSIMTEVKLEEDPL